LTWQKPNPEAKWRCTPFGQLKNSIDNNNTQTISNVP